MITQLSLEISLSSTTNWSQVSKNIPFFPVWMIQFGHMDHPNSGQSTLCLAFRGWSCALCSYFRAFFLKFMLETSSARQKASFFLYSYLCDGTREFLLKRYSFLSFLSCHIQWWVKRWCHFLCAFKNRSKTYVVAGIFKCFKWWGDELGIFFRMWE